MHVHAEHAMAVTEAIVSGFISLSQSFIKRAQLIRQQSKPRNTT